MRRSTLNSIAPPGAPIELTADARGFDRCGVDDQQRGGGTIHFASSVAGSEADSSDLPRSHREE